MKNIDELLKTVGLEIPADKKEAFKKEFLENYKTVAEVEGLRNKLSEAEADRDEAKNKYTVDMKQRDEDLKALQTQLAEAGEDKTKLEGLNTQLATLQKNYDDAQVEYQKKLAAQKKEFLIREKTNALAFSSNGAKNDFLAKAIAKEFAFENDTILGFDDFTNAYKEQDPGAFVPEKKDDDVPPPQFSGKNGGSIGNNGKGTDTPAKPRPIIW